jgi:hypothetical protein
VAGQTITTTGGAGTIETPYVASIAVPYSKATITLSDIVTTDSHASVNAIYAIDPDTGAGGVVSVSLTAGGATHVYIYARAENGTNCFYDITVTRAAAPTTPPPGGGNPGGGNPAGNDGGGGAAVTTTGTTGGNIYTPAVPTGLTDTNSNTGGANGTVSANGSANTNSNGTGNGVTQGNGGQISDPEIPLVPADNAGGFPWWIWLIIAAIVLAAIIWVLIAWKRRKRDEGTDGLM